MFVCCVRTRTHSFIIPFKNTLSHEIFVHLYAYILNGTDHYRNQIDFTRKCNLMNAQRNTQKKTRDNHACNKLHKNAKTTLRFSISLTRSASARKNKNTQRKSPFTILFIIHSSSRSFRVTVLLLLVVVVVAAVTVSRFGERSLRSEQLLGIPRRGAVPPNRRRFVVSLFAG